MIRENANAKINLFLTVLEKREDGFHNIKSVMHSVTLADNITVSAVESETTHIAVHTDSKELLSEKDNLCYCSAERYLAHFEKNANVEIHLEKKIPIGAGLAGGSSDAAATLRALNKIFGLASRDELLKIAAEIGSDVPFCLIGGTALCECRGEILTPLLPPESRHFVIAIGNERISTPEAYSELDKLYNNGFPQDHDITTYNIFEEVTRLPEVAKIKELLTKCGAEFTLMSGSGPSAFGAFKDKSMAQNARDELIKAGFEAYYAKSASHGEYI